MNWTDDDRPPCECGHSYERHENRKGFCDYGQCSCLEYVRDVPDDADDQEDEAES